MQKESTAFAVIWVAIAIATPLAEVRAEPRVERNVVYAMYSGLALLMDVHHPTESNGHAIVFIPGSGWYASSSPDATPLKEAAERPLLGRAELLESGYTLFAINHRAGPMFRYPAAVEDAQRAVRYVRHHADRFGIDRDRIGAFGGSSGGYLASMLGVLDGNGDPESESPVDRESAKVQTVVALFPATDFVELVANPAEEQGPLGPLALGAFLGAMLGGANAGPGSWEARLYREASVTSHVSADDPPFLLIHGDRDEIVPFAQSRVLEETLASHNITVELLTMPGGGHGPAIVAGPDAPDYRAAIVEWFDEHLQPALR